MKSEKPNEIIKKVRAWNEFRTSVQKVLKFKKLNPGSYSDMKEICLKLLQNYVRISYKYGLVKNGDL